MLHEHKIYWSQKSFIYQTVVSLVFLLVTFWVNSYANAYILIHSSNDVTDIILDNIPVVNVHLIFSEGAVAFIIILLLVLLYEPRYIPFSIKSIALFVLIRSFFLVLTHLAPPSEQIYIDPTDYIARISSGNDLFFSAHTGMPVLLSLVFWEKKILRYYFIFCALLGGVAVLLGHLHYSIDVFSAVFISFGIFHLSKRWFKKDYELAVLGRSERSRTT